VGISIDGSNGTVVYNNTIINGIGASADAFRLADPNTETPTLTVQNNIFDSGGNSADLQVDGATSTVTGNNNILVNDASATETNSGTYTAGGSDKFATDPLFLTNSAFITTSSPAKNAGITQTSFNNDVRGATRDTTYDIGAYEFKKFLKFDGPLTIGGITSVL
jgi:hypothetical protein